MATFLSKLLPQKSSGFVPSFSGCLSWCFRSSSSDDAEDSAAGGTLAEEIKGQDTVDYGTTKDVAVNQKKVKENGTAYNYEDAGTSSDSDDEVLRRYQQSIRRVPSERSIRSAARSQRSSVSRAVKGHHNEALEPDIVLSMGDQADDTASETAASVVPPSDYEVRHHDVRTREEVARSLAAGSTASNSLERVSVTGRSDPELPGGDHSIAEEGGVYENAGFQEELGGDVSPDQPSQTSSEKALSQYADTASMSVGDMDQDRLPLESADADGSSDTRDSGVSACKPLKLTMVKDRAVYVNPNRSSASFERRGRPSFHTSLTSLNTRRPHFGSLVSIGSALSLQEHLFDVSDLQDREPALISKCGNLEVTFQYDVERTRMNITVHQAREIPSKDRGGANNSQVRLLLLPTKKVRHKTKIKPGENPEFQETFQFKVPLEEVNNMGVRFRLYGCERMRRERMIGESVVGFASLNLDTDTTHMLTLEPRSNLSDWHYPKYMHGDSKLDVSSLSRSDSASSTQSMQHGGMPELLIGLSYNGTTGRLSVEVIKGSNFRNMAMNRAPDTYVKLTMMSPNGQEIARSKTSIRRGQPNPLYKETFMFQVALFQLPDVTLMVSVYNKRSMKRKEMIGWFSLGLNNSGEEELSHWNDMRESKGEQVCRWHVLLES